MSIKLKTARWWVVCWLAALVAWMAQPAAQAQPANDDFNSPFIMNGLTGSGLTFRDFGSTPAFQILNNVAATKDAANGEPNHSSNVGGRSVWYSWTPTSSGNAAISVTSFSTGVTNLIAVYQGFFVNSNSLALVTNNAGSFTNVLRFPVVANNTYRINDQ